MNGRHFDIEKRKLISHFLAQGDTLLDMGHALSMDPSSISKELKRNRHLSMESMPIAGKECAKTSRFPYVCNHCHKRYYGCTLRQYLYDAKKAQNKADRRLVDSRRGINMDKEEFLLLDGAIKAKIDEGRSVYDIVSSNKNIEVSVQTVYRYINDGLLSVKRMDLPYAVMCKKRKKKEKRYEYSKNNRIDRSNRTFMDYLSYRAHFPGLFTVQMDFLGSVASDSKSILTLTIPDMHFVMLFLVEKKNSSKIVSLFDTLEEKIGTETFKRLFPCILTDRDPSFSDWEEIEISAITGEIRTRVFYCDPYKSNQKASVENMNHQLRRYFPKKKSVDDKNQKEMIMVAKIINQRKTASLCGYCPAEAFIAVYGEETYKQLLEALG